MFIREVPVRSKDNGSKTKERNGKLRNPKVETNVNREAKALNR